MITKENCLRMLNENVNIGDVESKASAWSVVYNFLVENGIKEWRETEGGLNEKAGIEVAIGFLEHLVKGQRDEYIRFLEAQIYLLLEKYEPETAKGFNARNALWDAGRKVKV